MDIKAFKTILFDSVEKHERACVYERNCTDKEAVFSVYIDDTCFLVKCTQTDSSKKAILK